MRKTKENIDFLNNVTQNVFRKKNSEKTRNITKTFAILLCYSKRVVFVYAVSVSAILYF